MKVCINFGDIRCVVPVGDGSLTVKEVIDLAVERFRKATAKPADSKIAVHTLKTCDGAILDLDDILNHVADDREQLIALFDEFPDGAGGVYVKNGHNRSHSHSNGSSRPQMNGAYGEVNHAPTRRHLPPNSVSEPSKASVNRSCRRSVDASPATMSSSAHSMNHYSQLTARVEGVYGRTSTEQYQYAFGRPAHQRNGSVTDSLLSSNESPDPVLLSEHHETMAYGDERNGGKHHHHRSSSYSSAQVNGYRGKASPSNKGPNGASVTQPIAIGGNSARRNDFGMSRSYTDTNYRDEPDFDESTDVVEITEENISLYASSANRQSHMSVLHVRHGSDPSLVNPDGVASNGHLNGFRLSGNDLTNDQSSKRWSTAAATLPSRLFPAKSSLDANYEHSDEEKSFNSISPQSTKEEGYASEERPNSQSEPRPTQPLSPPSTATSPPFSNFSRGSGRQSMLGTSYDAWAEAADRQLLRSSERNMAKEHVFGQKNDQLHRKLQQQHQSHQTYDSSLGSMTSTSSQENDHHQHHQQQLPRVIVTQHSQSQPSEVISVIIDMTKESGPLGIHVLPDDMSSNSEIAILKQGLLIQGIEPGGRIDRDGRLHVGDIIAEIDDKRFAGLDFNQAQDMFRSSLQNSKIKLLIAKTSLSDNCDSQPPKQSANESQQMCSPEKATEQPAEVQPSKDKGDDEQEILVEGEARAGQQTKLATVTATRVKYSTGSLPLPSKPPSSAIVVANTRRIGKKYHIQLKKGIHGLGFTITTRDNPAGGLSPIYIKTILPRGAAVQDGRLKPGDRLLEVCAIEMTGKTQEEAVKILRNLPEDSIVDLIVSRQEVEMSPSPLMPRQLPPEKVNEPQCSSANEREILVFHIPLNDTLSSGLGVSVKGKTSNNDGKHTDLGIFIKAVFTGGAAWKDGRLRQDDQLVSINDIPLSGKTNSEAMETLRRAMIKPQLKNGNEGPKPDSITVTVARRVCRSPSHCTESNLGENPNRVYRHQHEASILSTDSYDMSFNPDPSPTKTTSNHTSPFGASLNGSSGQEEDSYRSSENTVIYNHSRMNQSSSPAKPETTYYDSELSLNDDGGERFRRDGFGRQSMSEKRHAQLDAKSTDTYRRNKKSRDETINLAAEDKEDASLKSPGASSQVSHRVQTNQTLSYGEDEQSDKMEAIRRMNSASIKENLPVPTTTSSSSITPPKSKSPMKPNQMPFFSPCCIKCQSPGSCPYHSKGDLDPNGRSRNGLYVKNTNATEAGTSSTKEMIVPPFGLRRSCSLESLQMMMQDLQKEQLEKVGSNIPGFAGARHGTVRVARSRETNESFRVAVDRSYDVKNYINRPANMDKVDEEFDSNEDSTSRPSTCPYRVGGGHSMTSTNFTSGTALTTTTNDDDNAQLIKPKKKKGLFKNLFHFGSRKGRSKSASSEPTERFGHGESHNSDEVFVRSPDLNRNRQYQAEQERINAQYRKLVEQAKMKQQQNQQFVRNQLHPLHQSMPAGQRSKTSPSKLDPMIGAPNGFHPGFVPSSQHYSSNLVHRDTVGVPHYNNNNNKNENNCKMNVYMRQHHRVHPSEMKMAEGNLYGDAGTQIRHNEGPRHLRGNSQDFYSRTSMDRPGSRVAISENSNYATQGIYSNYGNSHQSGQMVPAHGRQPDGILESNYQHYRQLSLRNPAQHHRQISSPAASQQFYGTTQRPVSSYFEYEHAAHLKNGDHSHKLGPGSRPPGYQVPVNYGANNETLYGLVGQQLAKRPPVGPQGAQQQQQQQALIRQQQPIYQSNQVQIYGSVYNASPNQQPTYGRLPPQVANRNYGSYNRNTDIYGTNGLPNNAYSTKG